MIWYGQLALILGGLDARLKGPGGSLLAVFRGSRRGRGGEQSGAAKKYAPAERDRVARINRVPFYKELGTTGYKIGHKISLPAVRAKVATILVNFDFMFNSLPLPPGQ